MHLSAHEWITLTKENTDDDINYEVLESNSTTYKVRIRINKIGYNLEQKNNNIYQKLYLRDSYPLNDVGKPALPLIIQRVGLPPGTIHKAEIIENLWTDISVERIFPAQKQFTTINIDTTFVVIDSIYTTDSFLHPILKESEIMNWKGVENVCFSLCPFIYRPLSNTLSVLTDFTFTVHFFEKKGDSYQYPKCTKSDLVIFDNKDFIDSNNNRNNCSNDSCDYLIIVGNIPEIENSQSMNDFCRWKALKGYRTKVTSTSIIGSDSASIKNYIAQQFANGVNQVLFVGNNDKIPLVTLMPYMFSQENNVLKSDYWYGCIVGDNDIQAELPIGRFFTNTLEQFTNMVQKTIYYESKYHEWSNRSLLISGSQTQLFQNILDSISNTTYNHPFLFYKAYGAPVSSGGLGSDKYDVINYINSGINIVSVNCHGNRAGFWMFDGINSTINYEDKDLLDDDTYPIIFSNACYNGDFTDPLHSISRIFSCSNHCSTAYTGTTMPSYINSANNYTKHLYTNILTNNIYNMGHAILMSHIMNLSYSDYAKDNALNYICGGDPSLEIWTGVQSLFESIRVFFVNGMMRIHVDNTEDYCVNIVSSNGELIGKYSSVGDSVTIPLQNNNFDISITKHDYVPYISHINVEDNYIQNVSLTDNYIFAATPLYIGYDVDNLQTVANVIINPNAKIIINKGTDVIIKNGFECKKGAEITIE